MTATESPADPEPTEPPVAAGRAMSPHGIPLPLDLRSGPIVAGVDDATACGRPLRAAAFLAAATGRPLLLVHVRRRAMPMVEGYVPIPEEVGISEEAEDAVEAELIRALTESGDLAGVTWELLSATGEAGGRTRPDRRGPGRRVRRGRQAALRVRRLPAPDRLRVGVPSGRRPAEVPRHGGALRSAGSTIGSVRARPGAPLGASAIRPAAGGQRRRWHVVPADDDQFGLGRSQVSRIRQGDLPGPHRGGR